MGSTIRGAKAMNDNLGLPSFCRARARYRFPGCQQKKDPSIVFVHVREQRPAFDRQRVKAR